MRNITMKDKMKREFVITTLFVNESNPFDIEVNVEELVCPNSVLANMIQRFVEGETFVLPYVREQSKEILWLILNTEFQKILQHADELKNFFIPTLAEPFPPGRPGRNKFDTDKPGMGSLGAELFPNGYICYRSPFKLLDNVLEAIKLWSQLDFQRPEISLDDLVVNAYVLRSQFQQHLSLQKWVEAEHVLQILQQGHYISDENYRFLKIQFLSAQGKWSEIWHSEDFSIICGLSPLPAAVRGALITSFYKSVIADIEDLGDVKETLTVFDQYKNELGTLLAFKAGLKGDLFLRVFAYQATLDKRLDKLAQFKAETQDEKTDEIITALEQLIELGESVDDEGLTLLEQALSKFREGLYDDAYLWALDCPPSVKSTQIILGIATMTEDSEICAKAADLFLGLDEKSQELILSDPGSKGSVKFVLGFTKPAEKPGKVKTMPTTWQDWFLAIVESEDKDSLVDCLGDLIDNRKQQWDFNTIKGIEDQFFLFIADDSITAEQKQLLKLSLPDFASFVLQDSNFPNVLAINLYEYLIAAIEEFCPKNSNNIGFLLRLSEGLLESDIEYCNKLWPEIKKVLDMQPTLNFSFYVLEMLYLFHEYGLSKEQLMETWNNWVGSLIGSFNQQMRTQISSWLTLGQVVNGDFNLLKYLKTLLAENVEEDPLTLLDSATITIFSCREKAAVRAANEIIRRNDNLKVRVCTDSKLTNEAKSYARNSDLVIIVTACISHALTYGITPFLSDNPLYPRSSGETGIIEVLENYAVNEI